jgi:hypothetical protein
MGLLNLGLSLVATLFESLIGMAAAALVAQIGLNGLLITRLCRHEGLDARAFLIRMFIHPLIFLLLLTALKLLMPVSTLWQHFLLGAAVLALVVAEFWLLGLRPHQMTAEFRNLLALLKPQAGDNAPAP